MVVLDGAKISSDLFYLEFTKNALVGTRNRQSTFEFGGETYSYTWSSLVEGDEQKGAAQIKHILNVAMHVLHIFLGCKHNTLPFGPILPSSPSTKELHELGYNLMNNPGAATNILSYRFRPNCCPTHCFEASMIHAVGVSRKCQDQKNS